MVQDTTALQTGWNIEDIPEHTGQQLFYVKALWENLQQKYNQFFWGLPSLHSESLVATLLFLGSNSQRESCCVLCNVSAEKMQHLSSPPPPHFHVFPLLKVCPQMLP